MLDKECPKTNNPIEGGVNAQLRRLLRYHRGMSVEKRIKAVFLVVLFTLTKTAF